MGVFEWYDIGMFVWFLYSRINREIHSLFSVLARISKGQVATSEKGTFMRKRWLKKGTLMRKD